MSMRAGPAGGGDFPQSPEGQRDQFRLGAVRKHGICRIEKLRRVRETVESAAIQVSANHSQTKVPRSDGGALVENFSDYLSRKHRLSHGWKEGHASEFARALPVSGGPASPRRRWSRLAPERDMPSGDHGNSFHHRPRRCRKKANTFAISIQLFFDSRKIRRAPVLKAGAMVGIVSRADFVRALVTRAEIRRDPRPKSDESICRILSRTADRLRLRQGATCEPFSTETSATVH